MSTPASEGRPRKRRADAVRNRKRTLDAAQELFAEGGSSVSMDEVARRAEVGIGTLYRHFPTKEALLEAASQHRFGEILMYYRAYYRTVCRDAADPIEGLRMLLVHIGEVERDRLSAAVAAGSIDSGVSQEARAGLEAEFVDLVRRGQTAGVIRPDVVGGDIFALTCGLSAIVHKDSGDWRRYIDIVLDGLRSPGTQGVAAPPALPARRTS